jgi:hypothetical protein
LYTPPARTTTPSVRIVLAALFALAAVLVPVALGAKGGNGRNKQVSVAPFSLVSEYVWNSPNPAAPTSCLNEDDFHRRTWSGALDGSFTATEQFCDGNVDYSGGIWWDAGGIGVQVDAYVAGTLSDLAITSPEGASHHAVLVGSTTSNGVKTDHYQVCYVPPFSLSYDIGGTPLPGGSWQISLSGSFTNARFSTDAEMADVTFQQQHCPPSQQNLNS